MKWYTAALLSLAIVALMVWNSADFFFHQPFYEIDDWAANSISIDRAKRFGELYGNYSRWGFHHPGPAYFYLYALGEWLFYDKLHLAAAPFNGQLFAHLVLMTGYFVAILAVISRWLPNGGRPWFVPLALAASALHFSVMANLAPDLSYTLHAPSALASPWSAHALVMPMLCLLTVGASVAAGRGTLLPLLAFTDGCLIHTHVAQPLFIAPLTLLAYLGLCWQGWRNRRAPWREFRRAHVWALLILAVFAAPIVADFFLGRNGNMAMILNHMRHHQGEHKPLIRSIFYFLQFGSYTEYAPNRNDFGHYDKAGALAYLRHHAAYYILWLAALALALRPLLMAPFRRSAPSLEKEPDAVATEAVASSAQRFLVWGGVFLIVGIALTLFWGTIQDGPMTYFNAWFNYSFYHFVALLALASLCARPTPWNWKHYLAAGGVAVAVCLALAGPLRVYDPAVDYDRATRAAIDQAIADTAPAPGQKPATKLLIFTQETWQMATGLALHLQRAGQRFVVPAHWAIVVGEQHRWRDFPAETSLHDLQIFRLHARQAGTARQPAYALPKIGGALTVAPSAIDPADEKRSFIEFRPHDDNNFLGFQVIGWSAKEKWGVWNDGRVSLLAFHPVSAGGRDVEMRADIIALLAPKLGLTEQKMRVYFNDRLLGDEVTLTRAEPELKFTIPSELWEQAAAEPRTTPVTLKFVFPTAVRPGQINPAQAGDMRLLAVGFHRLEFRKVEK